MEHPLLQYWCYQIEQNSSDMNWYAQIFIQFSRLVPSYVVYNLVGGNKALLMVAQYPNLARNRCTRPEHRVSDLVEYGTYIISDYE